MNDFTPIPINWKSLIRIDTSLSPETADEDIARISAILDKVATVPKGQEWLGKLQNRLNEMEITEMPGGQSILANPTPVIEKFITLQGEGKKLVVTTSREQRSETNADSVVNLNSDQASVTQYCGIDNRYHRFTFEHIVIHEIFGHVAANNMPKTMLFGNHRIYVPDKTNYEQSAVNITNEIQSAIHSTDIPRGNYMDACYDKDELLGTTLVGDGFERLASKHLEKTLCEQPPVEVANPLPTPPPVVTNAQNKKR